MQIIKPLKKEALLFCLAESEGFEPSIGINLYTLSRRAPSAARPALHKGAEDYIRLINLTNIINEAIDAAQQFLRFLLL